MTGLAIAYLVLFVAALVFAAGDDRESAGMLSGAAVLVGVALAIVAIVA